MGKRTVVARKQSSSQDRWKESKVKFQLLSDGQVRIKGRFSKRFSS